MTMPTAATTRLITCSVIGRHSGNRCTAEALDPDAEVLICARHTGLVMEMVNARMPTARKRVTR
ncbi:hypothetical protein ACFP2T_13570 [Plantactinospora solaniradicis]|uniref:DUF1540 domain-containing protein n=1 Tax=Plantactinospora solaniradicis TaxID=1723736 RepID=A0ABW1K7U3_9ACTN